MAATCLDNQCWPGVAAMTGFQGQGRAPGWRRAAGRVRRRGRRAPGRWLAVLLAALVAVVLAPRVVRVLAGPAGGPAVERVQVQAGDTLWAIAAARTGARSDVREAVQQIKQFNRLQDSTLQPGQILLIPPGMGSP